MDIDGYPSDSDARDNHADILETDSGSDAYLETLDIPVDIPEFLLRPELIPVKGDGLPAVAEAERVVRSSR